MNEKSAKPIGQHLSVMHEHKPPSDCASVTAPPQRPAINPEIADLLTELSMRWHASRAESTEQAEFRLQLLMEDVSEALTPRALAAAIKEGKLTWDYMPNFAGIMAAAKPYLAERAVDNRRRADALAAQARAAAQRSLPAPKYLDQQARDAAMEQLRAIGREADRRERDSPPALARAKGRMALNNEDLVLLYPRVPFVPLPYDDGQGPSPSLREFAARVMGRHNG